MDRTDVSDEEKSRLNLLLKDILAPEVLRPGFGRSQPARYDKRPNMYRGKGVVYLLQMFEEGELVNNRIGAYMILPTKNDSCGFHTHGPRREQELYLVLHGEGTYHEKTNSNAGIVSCKIEKGNLTTVKGDAFHAVENTGNEPLVIFVITTNEI